MQRLPWLTGWVFTGRVEMMDYLRQKARPFLFSSAVTPADVAACTAAVDIMAESDDRVQRLWKNAKYFQGKMREAGFDTGVTQTPITPIMLGEAPVAQGFSKKLFEQGVFAMAIGFPTVPRGKARIRVMISAAHSTEDLDLAIDKFRNVGKEMGVIS